jgi:hypothetical protein
VAHFTPIVEDAVLALIDTMPLDKNTKPRAYALIHRILHQVRRERGRERGVDLARGDVLTSIEDLGEGCGLSRQMVRNLLGPKHLGKSFLSLNPTNKYSVLHVVDMDTYINDGMKANPQPTNNQPATNQQPTSHTPEHYSKKEKEKEKERGDITPDSECDLLPISPEFDIQARMAHYRQLKTQHKARHNDLTVQQVLLRLHQSKDVYHELGEQLTAADADQIVTDWLTKHKPTQATGLFADSPWGVPWWRVCLDGGRTPKGNGKAEEEPRGFVPDDEVRAMTSKPAWISTRRFLKLHPEMNGDPRAQAEDQTHGNP